MTKRRRRSSTYTKFTSHGSTFVASTYRTKGQNRGVVTRVGHKYELFPRRITGYEGLKRRRYYTQADLASHRAAVYVGKPYFMHSSQARFHQIPGQVAVKTLVQIHRHSKFDVEGFATTTSSHRRPWRLEGHKTYYPKKASDFYRPLPNRYNRKPGHAPVLSKAARQRAAKKRRRVRGRFA